MIPNSYSPMPTHRLMSEFGEIFQLNDFLKEKFDYEIQKLNKQQSKHE